MSERPDFHQSWPEAERALLRKAIDRHGGWALWTRLHAVALGFVSLCGLLPWLKGNGRTFTMPHHATTYPKLGRTEWRDSRDGEVVVDIDGRGAHRRTFRGVRKLRRWSQFDACYFIGYALASYAAAPFILPSLRFIKPVRGRWRGQPLAGVRVEYPRGAEVHSLRQNYLFDDEGLLRRNDYVADIVGAFWRGSHGWDDFVFVEGLPVPTRRTVVPRLGTVALPGPVALEARLDDVRVVLQPPTGA